MMAHTLFGMMLPVKVGLMSYLSGTASSGVDCRWQVLRR